MYVIGYVRMTYGITTLTLHIHSLISQHYLREKPRDASPKEFDQAPTLNGSDQSFWLLPGSVEVKYTRRCIAIGC